MQVAVLCHEMKWTRDQYKRQPSYFLELLWVKLSADSKHQERQMEDSKSTVKRKR